MRELELLDHIYKANRVMPGHVLIPPGDDMAEVGVSGASVLVAVDQLADGVHFELENTPLNKVGRKAVTRCLSDVAAMGGYPIAVVVGASLPRGFGQDRSERLVDAMTVAGQAYGCPVVGGDVMVWDQRLVLSVTALATPGPGGVVTRSGAKVGDLIYVTGALGGSGEKVDGYTHHLDFEPRIEVARRLCELQGVSIHSMIDLSDGLVSDVCRVCERSEVSAVIHSEQLPISKGCSQVSRRDGKPAWEHALSDGEDYELCFTVPADDMGRLPDQINGVRISCVGEIQDYKQGGDRVQVRLDDHTLVSALKLGWEHKG